jgi:type VI secretion system secreted protein Hcp
MAVDMFLKLAAIDGESTDDKHKGSIDILSWSFAANQTGSAASGGGAGSGRVSIQDLTITKKVDKSSPLLFQHCCDGTHITDGKLTVRKAGGEALEYMKVFMEKIYVTGYQTTGSDGQDSLVEQITLSFKKVGIRYTPQLDDGSGDADTGKGWDVGANVLWEPPS